MSFNSESFKKKLVRMAIEQVGAPCGKYRADDNTGNSPEGFDCSGLVQYCLLQSGYELPFVQKRNGDYGLLRRSWEFFQHFGEFVSFEEVDEGDLIIFSKNPGLRPSHIVIYSGEGYCVEARGVFNYTDGNPTTVKSTPLERILSRKKFQIENGERFTSNPIAVKRPTINELVLLD